MGKQKLVEFIADKVKVKTGRVDNSAQVTFDVGEYALKDIKDLITVIDQPLKVTVEMDNE